MEVTPDQLRRVASVKYGKLAEGGWGPRLRARFGHYTPDDWYEALLDSLVGPATRWLDVGCGREILPFSPAGAASLSQRCASLTGLDPSDNIDDNPYVHHRAKCMLEDFAPEQKFDLVTLRMVVEHITAPQSAAAALSRLCAAGGLVVIYTVDKYSPVSLVSAFTPMSVHHAIKYWLWRSEERDTFPTAYLMNTRASLRALMSEHGFAEAAFFTLSDTRTTNRFFLLNVIELSLWRVLRALALNYPEKCLMGVYRKVG